MKPKISKNALLFASKLFYFACCFILFYGTIKGQTTRPTAMDSMTYHYNAHTNQLSSISDGVPNGNYSNDLDNEMGDNYKYDKNGNIIFDSSQHLTITWNARNKIATVMNDSTHLLIIFGYDALCYRVMKKDTNTLTHLSFTTWYIRGADGNVLSTYVQKNDSLYWKQAIIYGTSRVGVYYPDSLIYPKQYQVKRDSIYTTQLWEGKKLYELTNHLGNVLTTVSDKKIMLASNAIIDTGTRNEYANISSYQPEVIGITDYYPGGMPEPGRTINAPYYHYGFNGQEKDDDIEGKGDLNTAEYWEYDTRLGRRWNLDPEPNAYESNYVAFLDNPIWHSDVLGNSADGPPTGPILIGPTLITTALAIGNALFGGMEKQIQNNENVLFRNVNPNGTTPTTHDKVEAGIDLALFFVNMSPEGEGESVGGGDEMSGEESGTGGENNDLLKVKDNSTSTENTQTKQTPTSANKELGGQLRAKTYSEGWEKASLKETVDKFAQGAKGEYNPKSGKTTYTNSKTNFKVVSDNNGNYFRVYDSHGDPVGLNGQQPNLGGRTEKEASSSYQQQTHFVNTDANTNTNTNIGNQ